MFLELYATNKENIVHETMTVNTVMVSSLLGTILFNVQPLAENIESLHLEDVESAVLACSQKKTTQITDMTIF